MAIMEFEMAKKSSGTGVVGGKKRETAKKPVVSEVDAVVAVKTVPIADDHPTVAEFEALTEPYTPPPAIQELAGCLRKLVNASGNSNNPRQMAQRETAREEAYSLLERLNG